MKNLGPNLGRRGVRPQLGAGSRPASFALDPLLRVRRQDLRTELTSRAVEVERARQTLERFHFPRLQMVLIVALTGAIGFITSFALLHLRVEGLWLRYPLAVGAAYAGFLVLLWCWLRLRKDRALDLLNLSPNPPPATSGECPPAEPPFASGGGSFGGGGTSGSLHGDGLAQAADAPSALGHGSSSLGDAAGALGLGELGLFLVAIAALLGAGFAVCWIISDAPALMAELMVDAALMTGLYRRLRGSGGGSWLRTAIRRTAVPFAGVALFLGLAGAILQVYAPGATTIGQVMAHHAALN